MLNVLDNLLIIGAVIVFVLLMKFLPWEKARSASSADGVQAPYGFSPTVSSVDEDEDILTPVYGIKEEINPATGLPMVIGSAGVDIAGKRYGES